MNPMMYAAVYTSVSAALTDLEAFERLHTHYLTGIHDAAVLAKEDGEPQIVRRVDTSTFPAIDELLNGPSRDRHPLHEAAEQLFEGEAAFVVVGEPALEKAFDRAVTRKTMTAKHTLNSLSEHARAELVFGA